MLTESPASAHRLNKKGHIAWVAQTSWVQGILRPEIWFVTTVCPLKPALRVKACPSLCSRLHQALSPSVAQRNHHHHVGDFEDSPETIGCDGRAEECNYLPNVSLTCGLSWLCVLEEWVDLEDSSLEDSSLEGSRADLGVVRGLEDPTGRPFPRLLIGLTYWDYY